MDSSSQQPPMVQKNKATNPILNPKIKGFTKKFLSKKPKPTHPIPRPSLTILSLPAEIRQEILLNTYPLTELHPNRYIDYFLLREKHQEEWIATLRAVHPLLARDMEYVAYKWRQNLFYQWGNMYTVFKHVWIEWLWEDEANLTPQQVDWTREYRAEWMELGAWMQNKGWKAKHPVLKQVRRIPGLKWVPWLRQWLRVDENGLNWWEDEWVVLREAWIAMKTTISEGLPGIHTHKAQLRGVGY